jgi:nucleoside-diphosphate-sugar epimerase
MRVAVTGASGFLGRYVVEELTARGHETVAVVRDAGRLLVEPPSSVVELDVAAPPPDAFDRMGRPDALIHLAWGGLPAYRSLHHFEHELPAAYLFLSTLVDEGLRNLMVTGTCFEYGMQSGPLDEDMVVLPALPYAYAKDALRRQLEFASLDRFAFTWARLFYLYGDGQAAGSLLPQLQRALSEGKTEFPMSGGEQLRDFIHVREAASTLVALVEQRQGLGVVNVCSGKPVSVRSFVERWLSENGYAITLKLGHYPYPDYEPMAFWGSRAKLDNILRANP